VPPTGTQAVPLTVTVTVALPQSAPPAALRMSSQRLYPNRSWPTKPLAGV